MKQLPVSLNGAHKSDVRIQFAALCYRVKKGKIQILLVTSRGTGRWIVPKGWPMEGKTPAKSALTEAWEEGGVNGKTAGDCVGVYSYAKLATDEDDLSCNTPSAGCANASGSRARKPRAWWQSRSWRGCCVISSR